MKITNIKVTPVNIPLELPFLWTAGLYPGTSKTVIQVETDEGIVGLGEAPSSLGGINRAIRFIGACEAMGVGFWCYSGDAGICTAAYLHVTAAMPWMHEPSQALLRWQIGDVIQGGPFKPKNNVVPVPEGPGLGVELDRDALKHWHQHYLDNGPVDHFYDPSSPGYFRRLPLN